MTQQKIRVLHLLRSLGIGGAERRVLRLGTGLDPERFEVHALSFYRPEGQSLEWPQDRHHFFPVDPGIQWRRLDDLVSFLRENRFDVVHSHNWATMFYGVLAGRLARTPVVLHGEHGRNDTDRARVPWKRDLLASALARLVTRVVAVNEAISVDVCRRWHLDSGHVVCIPNGVDLLRFRPPTEVRTAAEDILVGTVARFDGIKNLSCLVSAFTRLCEVEPRLRARLVLVGDGPLSTDLRDQAARSVAADRIEFVGETKSPQDWYRRFDVFANTSFSEGMSNSILEAMACGVPVVASDIPGNRCWLRDGENALFFPSNDVEALANCLRRLATDMPLAQRIGTQNLNRVRSEYDNRNFLDRYSRMYEQLLAGTGRRPAAK